MTLRIRRIQAYAVPRQQQRLRTPVQGTIGPKSSTLHGFKDRLHASRCLI
jgi:hypothetical protein